MKRYDTRIPIPIDRYKKIGTICIRGTCLAAQTAQSFALKGLEVYPTLVRLNQWQPKTQTTVHQSFCKC
jgi:hypothetical protein